MTLNDEAATESASGEWSVGEIVAEIEKLLSELAERAK